MPVLENITLYHGQTVQYLSAANKALDADAQKDAFQSTPSWDT